MTAVPTPRTWALNEVATSPNMNSGIGDPLTFLLTRPVAQLIQVAAQNLAVFPTYTPITFTTEAVDTANGHDNTTNPSRYTAAYPGWYCVSGAVSFAGSATGRRWLNWRVNGTVVPGSQVVVAASIAADISVPARTCLVFLNAGDYVELACTQDSGGVLATYVGSAEARATATIVWQSN